MILRAVIAVLIGYLIGAIPSGIIVGRAFGIDVRAMGSGKTGATNVLRSAGWKAGLIVATSDVLKGAVPVLLARLVYATPTQVGSWATWIAALSGVAAIVGHNYPIYVGFRGGRGVATTAGMSFALALPATLITSIFFFAIIIATRYVSLGSILGSVGVIIVATIFLATGHGDLVSGLAGVLALVFASITIIYSHRDNIERLRTGTERKLGERAQPDASTTHS